ncbi:unnamed protein product [Anisakis simplex]|uniref:Uncharacterized protein n=1 Tax=Anisakis simplex TaxID=6269 RepID=A0A0M3JZ50_ANISI|nr:unnamed protein product [Anisakis simplex]
MTLRIDLLKLLLFNFLMISSVKSFRRVLFDLRSNSKLPNRDDTSNSLSTFPKPFKYTRPKVTKHSPTTNDAHIESVSHRLSPVSVIEAYIPLEELGFSKKEVAKLCTRYSRSAAAHHCFKSNIPIEFVDKCSGFRTDCARYIFNKRPIAKLANSFQSGAAMTMLNIAADGVPFYPLNQAGSMRVRKNAKVNFGSWGGGLTENTGLRTYWKQTTERGFNWHKGLYGTRSSWRMPVLRQFGLEGGQGTQVQVPIKDGSVGRIARFTNGTHFGPYFGAADTVDVDWSQGAMHLKRSMSSPFVGVSMNTGANVKFPSFGNILKRFSGGLLSF